MKRKELRELARKIAKQEKIYQSPNSSLEQKQRAEQEIVHLTSCVDSLDDITRLDEMILDILED